MDKLTSRVQTGQRAAREAEPRQGLFKGRDRKAGVPGEAGKRQGPEDRELLSQQPPKYLYAGRPDRDSEVSGLFGEGGHTA